ncbi:MAG: hypothetical protein EPN72_02065 [Nevskiaceae bacterium]|nr:MAG: hypothetical protein EPN63_12815 [Nevskiaceae bacterium]TBR74815.1 MAG: hypothetical protein EPN72_02065 [Nevskiaceae bacterium]
MTDASWSTLLDIDRAARMPKGSAFRGFKRLLPTLQEGTDFVVLDAVDPAPLMAELSAAGRVYRSSLRIVLLAPETARRIVEAFTAQAHP